MLTRFERGLIAHLIADWILQNDWMARYKSNLLHPAAWTHALIYTVVLTLALGKQAGAALGFLHLLVDTRTPLQWWQRLFRQTTTGPVALHTAIWVDQVIHIASIALWIAYRAHFQPRREIHSRHTTNAARPRSQRSQP